MEDRDVFYKQVGEKIRAQRGKDLSQDALASAVGLTRTSISNIENGRQRLLLHTLADIAAALKVDAATLLPARKSPADGAGSSTLARLPENERVFIESAIGMQKQRKDNHGSQTKENPGVGRVAIAGQQRDSGSSPRLGNRPTKGSQNRR